ncbi:MAG TPA: AMP-binding protein, partial [Acidimicrobiales bacterium]|nr:AMP-binding protein [Acidimicrobiales bacterium]
MDFNVAAVHEALGAALGDREAIVTTGRRWSWADLQERSRRLGNFFAENGLRVHVERTGLAPHECGQDTVAIYLHNGAEYLETMLGAFKARLAPCNVNYRYVEAELSDLLADMRPRAIVYHGAFADRLARVVGGLEPRPLLVQVPDLTGTPLLAGAFEYEAALAGAASTMTGAAYRALSPDDLYVLYTGGTTGRPKGVLWRQADAFVAAMGGRKFSERREWDSVDELVAAATNKPGPRTLSAAPFMHGTGQWVCFQTLHAGGTVIIPDIVDHFSASDLLDTIERERVQLLVIAGEAFARPLLDALAERSRDLSSLLVVASSGATLSPSSKAALLGHLPHLRIRDTVGSSETGPQGESVHRRDEDGASSRTSAVGARFRAVEGTCVVDELRQKVLAPGHDGTGWLARSGRIPLGYLHDAERTARTFPVLEGVRMSIPGDRARLLPDGTIELLGRDAATINSGGEKIFAEEVESALRVHPGVRD